MVYFGFFVPLTLSMFLTTPLPKRHVTSSPTMTGTEGKGVDEYSMLGERFGRRRRDPGLLG